MSQIDLDRLLADREGDDPCGVDLEYDPAFLEMETLSRGKPEEQYGDTIIPAEEPNWKEVQSRALDILGRSHDLRAAVYLSRALLRVTGLTGFEQGVRLIRRLLEERWEGVHPRLDPDDGDPIFRVNSLLPLADPEACLRPLQAVPLVQSRALGSFSYRDFLMSQGSVTVPEGKTAPDPAAIEGAFQDCEAEELEATARAIRDSRESVQKVEEFFREQVGNEKSVDLSGLIDSLGSLDRLISEKLAARGLESGEGGEAAGDDEASGAGEGGAEAPAPRPRDEISSRQDVVRTLDKICQYYQRHEPSSPIPFLLERAKRLVDKNFLDIMRDIAPDGISQTEMVTGVDTNED